MTALERFPHRLTIVTGHYGTGKTEFSVNLALALAGEGARTALADLDIVNPYFRSREQRELLEAAGVRVLARYRPRILREDYQLLYVVNAARPEVRTAERSAEYLRAIEAVTGLRCTGLVNNTHLCGETGPEDIREGALLTEEVSRMTGVPIVCHAAEARFQERLRDLNPFPMEIRMKKPWE